MQINVHAAATTLILAGSLVPAAAVAGGLERLEYQQILMGVPVRVLVYAGDKQLANAAVHAAFDRIRQLNLIFSDYDEDSEISRLVRQITPGRPVPVSGDLAFILAESLQISRHSEGAFDVTVGPLVGLWRASRRTKRLPSSAEIAAAKKRVGYESVHLVARRRTVELAKANMRLDFGGIVKGYAADEARAVLRSHGLPQALVALSGDISAGDPPPGQSGWKIGVVGLNPAGERAENFIRLRNHAVSTAGDAFQFVEIAGKRYSHLVDPRTGLGITRRVSVTVIAKTGVLSDGLDSAVAILGVEKGMKLLQQTPEVSGRIIEQTPNGAKTFDTPGFSKFLIETTASPTLRK